MDYQKFLRQLSDRSEKAVPSVMDYLDHWGCDLKGRTPKRFEGEDGSMTVELDLPALIMELVKQQAVINIPTYHRAGPRVVKDNEVVLSSDNRHGKVKAPSSHKEFANLGINIVDANVIKDGSVGAPRTYNFCGVLGEFRDESAWTSIEIFGADDTLADEVSLTCTVNQERWSSVYGRPYLVAKAAALRLEDEFKYYNGKVRGLRKMFPRDSDGAFTYPTKETGNTVDVTVVAFEAKVDGFTMTSSYPEVEQTLEGLEAAERHLSTVRRTLTLLRFPIRVSEAAFLRHCVGDDAAVSWCSTKGGTVRSPSWANDAEWETGFKQSARHKQLWARREMPLGFHLCFRAWNQKVALAEEEANRISQAA